jgi:hypothetical protein
MVGLPVLAAVALAALVWLGWRALPGWAETWLEGRALRGGLSVVDIPIQHIGLTGSRVGVGGIERGRQRLDWEAIELNYGAGLLRGRADTLTFSGPALHIVLPGQLPLMLAAQPPAGPAADERAAEIRQPQPGEDQPPDGAPGDAPPALPAAAPELREPLKPAALLAGLPLRAAEVRDGRFDLQLGESRILEGRFSSGLWREQGGLGGEFQFTSERLNLESLLRSDTERGSVQLQNRLEVDVPGVLGMLDTIARKWELPGQLPDLRGDNPLTVDLLVVSEDSGGVTASGEARFADFELRPQGTAHWVRVANLLLAGTHENGRTRLQAGLRVEDLARAQLQVGGFAVRGGFDSETGLRLETEPLAFDVRGWTGKAALRARAGPVPGKSASAELAFDRLDGPDLRIDPASLLLDWDAPALRLKASPLGLTRAAVLWVEDVEVQWDSQSGAATAGFSAYNSLGAPVGTFNLSAAAPQGRLRSMAFTLADASGSESLSGAFEEADGRRELRLDGLLPLDWLNALGRFQGVFDGRLAGTDPRLEVQLAEKGGFLTGAARLDFDQLDLRLNAGPVFAGIAGGAWLRVQGLPQTEGMQQLRIESVTTGEVRLEGVRIDWALPTIRHLRIAAATARLAKGDLSIDPFTVDPLAPIVQTRLRIRSIEANALLDWLGEERFEVQGRLSGDIPLRWSDGVLELGATRFAMDPSPQGNWFRFVDRAFLTRQFAALAAIPNELLNPMLDALLKDGIRIDQLVLETVPLPRRGEVSLRLTLSGEARSVGLVVPIRGLVINNVISERDLGHLLGLVGPVRFRSDF